MRNPNGPSQEQIDDWNDELHDEHHRANFVQDNAYLENRLALCRLREQRMIDRLNWHEATKAHAQADYWLRRLAGYKVAPDFMSQALNEGNGTYKP